MMGIFLKIINWLQSSPIFGKKDPSRRMFARVLDMLKDEFIQKSQTLVLSWLKSCSLHVKRFTLYIFIHNFVNISKTFENPVLLKNKLCEVSKYRVLFWSIFSCIRTEHRDLL